jgi:hypothetical protein
MRTHTLDLIGNPGIITLMAGIAIGNSARERDGVALGIPERVTPDFVVRLGSGDNAPDSQDGRVVDCIPMFGNKVQNGNDVIWLEKTPTDQRQVNKSMVCVTGYSGYTLIAGSPKSFAGGPSSTLLRMKPNSAVQFLTPNGRPFVLYTDNDAREPKVLEASKFDPKFLQQGTAPVSTVRDVVPTGTSR